ncbi:MAG: hypothetical protein RL323_2098 [Pseudomonadota bacterium]
MTPVGRWTERPSIRWALGLGLLLMSGMGLVLLYLLTLATDNRELYENNYSVLFAINLAVAGLLLVVILWLIVRLWRRLRLRKFGSRLLLKLAAIFGVVGLVPGVLIYTVSYQFVSRSIESWFDVRVESALNAGLSLGRTTLDTLAEDVANKTRAAAMAMSTSGDTSPGVMLERWREQMDASDVVLWTGNGQAVASAGASRFKLTPVRPSTAELRNARSQKVVWAIEGLEAVLAEDVRPPSEGTSGPARIRALAWVPATNYSLQGEVRYLQVIAPLPAALVADALAIQQAHREYQERALAREGLRRMYIGTLTLALFLAVVGAVLLAAVLGNQLVKPLLVLAEGMREVARGDLTPKTALPAGDELAGLTRTFAHMTQELSEARTAVQQSMGQVDAARNNLQTLLDNLTAGVVVLDADNRVLSANPGATRVLRCPVAAYAGQSLAEVPGLDTFAAGVQEQFDGFVADQAHHDGGHWQQSFELTATSVAPAGFAVDSGNVVSLIARGALLPNGDRLLVFDDVSEVMSAQRARAWGEVARRLAHEIKNPLTPIQLSAERLAMKLDGKLLQADQTILNKSVKTIVDQVDSMKRLVNEFRDYARLPAAQLALVDLNALVRDIAVLYENAVVEVALDLAEGLPSVQADPQQVRQVLHNLVQNAQDATPAGAGPVLLQTRLSDSGRWVRLRVLDHGPGFSPAILRRAFEPYVTTKAKGTGLGLAVVKKIMDEHGGRIEIGQHTAGDQTLGAQVSLSFKVANLQQNKS